MTGCTCLCLSTVSILEAWQPIREGAPGDLPTEALQDEAEPEAQRGAQVVPAVVEEIGEKDLVEHVDPTVFGEGGSLFGWRPNGRAFAGASSSYTCSAAPRLGKDRHASCRYIYIDIYSI